MINISSNRLILSIIIQHVLYIFQLLNSGVTTTQSHAGVRSIRRQSPKCSSRTIIESRTTWHLHYVASWDTDSPYDIRRLPMKDVTRSRSKMAYPLAPLSVTTSSLLYSRIHTYAIFKGGRSSRTSAALAGSRLYVPRNLRYIIFGWDDLTVDLPFVQFMGVGLGHKLGWQWRRPALPPPTKLGKPGRRLVTVVGGSLGGQNLRGK